MPDTNSVPAVDAPPLPILPNPYGSDLGASQEASQSTAEEEAMMREEFSKSCDHEEFERDGGGNDSVANETSATGTQSSKARGAKPKWLPNEYQWLWE
jgi:hypothetical protein